MFIFSYKGFRSEMGGWEKVSLFIVQTWEDIDTDLFQETLFRHQIYYLLKFHRILLWYTKHFQDNVAKRVKNHF